jgi:hypothetical protein
MSVRAGTREKQRHIQKIVAGAPVAFYSWFALFYLLEVIQGVGTAAVVGVYPSDKEMTRNGSIHGGCDLK